MASLSIPVGAAAIQPDHIQVACYYFPDFHPHDARNDRDHGFGWDEWQLVKDAKPLFPGANQPRVPAWGYANEADPKAMAKKINAAADHGIDAFIFDWYWYDGPFLEDCLDKGYLKAPNRSRVKFALMWANHDWIDVFPVKPGVKGRLMYPGDISPASFDRLCDHVIHDYFTQPTYWRVDGKPYFSIYELYHFVQSFGGVEGARAALDRFRAKAVAAGLPGIHLNAVVAGIKILPGEHAIKDPADLLKKLGFDSVTSYVWIHHAFPAHAQTDYNEIRDGYFDYWKKADQTYGIPYFPNATVGWDPTPRNYLPTRIVVNNTPERFEDALRSMKIRLLQSKTEPKILNINAWNEWTEGSYLEPDTIHGMQYLDAVKNVFRTR